MSALRSPSAPRRVLLGPAAFLLLTGVMMLVVGIPYQRDSLAIWLLAGLLCFSLTDLRGYLRGVILDWLPFMAILIAYDSLRGSAAHVFSAHYLPQLQIDRWLFGGDVPTVALQHWLWHGHVTWYVIALWAVYLTHFFATPLLAAVLWKRDRERFRRFAVLVTALSFAALITYALYPAAPPWMAAQRGFTTPLARIIPEVWQSIGLHSAGSFVEDGYKYANDVAAVPSLHAAFSLLIAVMLWPRHGRRRWLRPVVAAYPLLMAFALVLGAEHYVFDIILGWGYTAAVLLVARPLWRRYGARRSVTADAPLGPSRGRVAIPEPALAESSAQA